MHDSKSLKNQPQFDSELLQEFTEYLNQNGNIKKLDEVKTFFIETYLDNLRDGMSTKDALQKAKLIVICFLLKK